MSTKIDGNNLVYIANLGGGIKLAAKEDTKLDSSAKHADDYFVETKGGDTAIDHKKLYGRFLSQYQQKPSKGDRQVDAAQKDVDFNQFQQGLIEEKSDRLLDEIGTLPPEQRSLIREQNREIESLSKYLAAQGKPLSSSEMMKMRYKGIAELAEKGKVDQGLGTHAKELYVLSSYSDSSWEYTFAKYGVPFPGQANPYNEQGRQIGSYLPSVSSDSMRQAILQQQRMQAMVMMSLFGSFSMGFFPFAFMGWR